MINGTIVWYMLSAVALAFSVAVVASRRPINAILSLLCVMLCLAALFVMLEAYLIAALQILLYAGAVVVLFVLATMLLPINQESPQLRRPFIYRLPGTLLGVLIGTQLVSLILRAGYDKPMLASHTNIAPVELIGRMLFSKYLLPVELVSFVILIAIIGVVMLVRLTDRKAL